MSGVILLLTITLPTTVLASGLAEETAHSTTPPFMSLLASILFAMIGGELAVYVKLPRLVGQVVGGFFVASMAVILGDPVALAFQGRSGSDIPREFIFMEAFTQLAILFIMFEAGFSEHPHHFRKEFISGLPLAITGAVLPAIGCGVLWVFLDPASTMTTPLTVAATMAATSISIAVGVVKGFSINGNLASNTKEAKIAVAASVGDDVVGLSFLNIISHLIIAAATGIQLSAFTLGYETVFVFAKSLLFIYVTTKFGTPIFSALMKSTERFERSRMGVLVSWMLSGGIVAWIIGLEPVLGAFAFGLPAFSTFWRHFPEPDHGEHYDEKLEIVATSKSALRDFVIPIFFGPFFFSIGAQIRYEILLDMKQMLIAAVITIVAVATKFLAAYITSRKHNWKAIGAMMVARAEVGLIFISFGLANSAITVDTASVLTIVVIATTIIGPILTNHFFTKQLSLLPDQTN